ncbi:hypothetical protein IMSAGC019_01543 [Lachnospiraceae bacterium]|nr:hypothetical protein IMSAGC019_01543 [Lachnospiraceae bacterium]
MRAKAKYPKRTLSCLMTVGAYAAVYGRLHGMRIVWKLFCQEMNKSTNRLSYILMEKKR